MEPLLTPALPCPECREDGIIGMARIGNRRKYCNTCNRWVQAVRREILNRLVSAHADEAGQLRPIVERDLYPKVIERYDSERS
jgi:hypothetical protein